MLVESGVRRVPFGVRDRLGRCLVQLTKAPQLAAADTADRALRGLKLEREPNVIAVSDRRFGERGRRSSRGET